MREIKTKHLAYQFFDDYMIIKKRRCDKNMRKIYYRDISGFERKREGINGYYTDTMHFSIDGQKELCLILNCISEYETKQISDACELIIEFRTKCKMEDIKDKMSESNKDF